MSGSERITAELYSKLHLLEELAVAKHTPPRQAFQEYLGMLPVKYHPTRNVSLSQQTFVDSILHDDRGLPVLILQLENQQHLILLSVLAVKKLLPV